MESLLQFFITHNVILTSAIAFGLGMWVYFDKRDDTRNITFGGLLVIVALWSFAFVLWRVTDNDQQSLFWLRSIFFVSSILPPLYFCFVYAYLFGKMLRPLALAALFLPNVLLGWIAYYTPLLIMPGRVPFLSFGVGRIYFAVHFSIIIISALVVFIFAARKNRDLDRGKLASVLVGTIIAFDVIFAVMFGGQLMATANTFWIGNVAMLLGMFIIAYAVIDNKLLVDLRLVSVEVFILLTLFVIITDIIVAKNMIDFSMRVALLVVLIFYGVMTSRNMVREVRFLREREGLMEQMTQMNGRLLQADRTKTQFVSLASHQFRAPCGGIRSYLDMLYNGEFGELTDEQKRIIAINIGACNQLLDTIETFLNVTKIELGKLELYKTEVKLHELVPRVIQTFVPVAAAKQIVVESAVAPQMRPVYCDSGKIHHVLANLIDNSIKYSGSGGRITVSATQKQGGLIAVRVTDTGAGLSAGEIDKLFGSFKRGLAGIELNKDGSGLGLFLVKNIVEAHGGEVFVESPGKGLGSTFGFTLPAGDKSSVVTAPLTQQKQVV